MITGLYTPPQVLMQLYDDNNIFSLELKTDERDRDQSVTCVTTKAVGIVFVSHVG